MPFELAPGQGSPLGNLGFKDLIVDGRIGGEEKDRLVDMLERSMARPSLCEMIQDRGSTAHARSIVHRNLATLETGTE